MYFDLRNHDFSSSWFDGAGRLATSVGSIDERFAFGDELRRENQRANCEILAMPGDHGLGGFGDLNEERVFRLVFLTQLQLPRWRTFLSSLRDSSDNLDPDLAHHECPERWCSLVEGPLSNSSNDALSHSRSATRR